MGICCSCGEVIRNIQVCIRSSNIGDILYYVLSTIKFSIFFKVEICILINCPIRSFKLSIFYWNTYETSHRVINHSLIGGLNLIHLFNVFK